jgi:death-on-curing protein
MTGRYWLDRELVIAIHEEQLEQHGGGVGVRDNALLESALARPINLAAHDESADIAALAAAYAFGIARNHPFVDGNKRTAYVAMELFLLDHGVEFLAEDGDAVLTFVALAAGQISENELAVWIRKHSSPAPL